MTVYINGTTGYSGPVGTIGDLTTTGNTTLGDASTDTLNVGAGGLVKDASGNVGIGTASPLRRLDVVSDSTGVYQSIRSTSSGATNVALLIQDGTTGTGSNGIYLGRTGATNYLWTYQNEPWVFATNNTERMRIDASGNLLVNTTTGYGKFTVQNNAGTGKVLLDNYVSIPTTENVLSIYADASRGYIQSYNNGYKDIIICGSGGNLGVGTTSPSEKLQVAGSIRITSNANNFNVLGGQLDFITDTTRINAYNSSGSYITFYTNASGGNVSEKVRIDPVGDFYINRTAPGSGNGFVLRPNGNGANIPLFDIRGSSFSNSNTIIQAYSLSSSAYAFFIQWNGQIYAQVTSISSASDASLKENIRPLETGLSEIMALQPRRFDWIDGRKQNVAGFVAQEVQPVLPDLVEEQKYSENDDGTTEHKLGIRMSDMIPTLVKAIQELKAEFDAYKLTHP